MALIQRLWQPQKNEQEQGQALVEFALVLIFVVIPITFILIETSVILYKYVSLTNAAREGARAGSIYMYVGDPGGSYTGPDTGRGEAVKSAVMGTMGPGIIRPPDCAGTSADTMCQVIYGPHSNPLISDTLRSTDIMTVTVTHRHPFLFGALGGHLDLEAHATMRIEPSTIISGP